MPRRTHNRGGHCGGCALDSWAAGILGGVAARRTAPTCEAWLSVYRADATVSRDPRPDCEPRTESVPSISIPGGCSLTSPTTAVKMACDTMMPEAAAARFRPSTEARRHDHRNRCAFLSEPKTDQGASAGGRAGSGRARAPRPWRSCPSDRAGLHRAGGKKGMNLMPWAPARTRRPGTASARVSR